MNMTALKRPPSSRHLTVFVLLLAGLLVAAYALPGAQAPAKKAMTIDDYTKWRSIERQAISGDGKWVAYALQTTNVVAAEAKPVLHLLNLETSVEVTVADAMDGTFSPDSRWIAYQVDPGAAQRGRGGRGGSGGGAAPADAGQSQTAPSGQGGTQSGQGAPSTGSGQGPSTGSGQGPSTGSGQGRGGAAPPIPPRRVEVRNLATAEVRSWQDIGTFAFSATSTHLYLRRRGGEAAPAAGGRGGGGAPGGQPPTGAGQAAGAAGAPAGARGVDAILLDLRTGRQQLLGSVADIAFNRTGELLAYTVDAAVKDVNGLVVFDTRTGRTTTLDSDAKNYNRLTWNEDGNALAVLKGSDVEKMRERDNVLIAFPDVVGALKDGASVAAPAVLQPAKTDSFPKGWVVSDRAALAWSEDNTRVFFGIKEQVSAPDTTRRTTDEAADVDVWNTSDDRVQSLQLIRATQDRNFTFRQAFDVGAKRFIRLTDDTMRDLDVAPDGKWAVGRDTRAYLADQKKLPAADFYRVNTATGERTLIAQGQLTGRHVFGISPHGTHFLYWKDNRFQTYDLNANATRTLGGATPVSFIDTEDDHPGTRPSFGIAGFTSDGKAVIVNHLYDLWLLPLDGSAPTNLTGGLGSKNEMRFRLVRTEQLDPSVARAVGPRGTFDLTKPVTLSAYGQWTKKAGFYELGGGQMKELVYEDASFSTPVKARKADRFLFTRQTFVEFPDLRVSGPGFADSKKITDANPQQKDFLWGHRLLFDFKNKDGVRLQGILAVPDDYKPGEKRPMIVTFYEKNSQNMHVYTPPVYMVSMGRMPTQATSDGYLTMMPDVHFRTGSSHSDMLECVEAATRKVIEMGYADPKRIGVTGHSYGGEGAAYVGTMSKMFAAIGMGAGVVDLYNDFNMNWGWSYAAQGGSGDTAFRYYLYDQGRWGFSPWDQPDRYHNESALTWAPKAVAPFLIMHGTSDPTVGFINGLAFYNALRYNGKKAVLLAYPGEGHHLGGVANQKDLTVRFMEFFDHYLKGAPAPEWLSDGVPYLKKDASREPAKR
ncbi:MAG: prolyl oligopeptidase family serine peptidase [Acidobacteria bacterium]|nr:prolyl oligopeptidase family serine peptidase [Acidobacteriota bacterium]